MPTFRYQALDERGKRKKGFVEAETQARAFSQLQDQGFMPVQIQSVDGKGGRGHGVGIGLEQLSRLREQLFAGKLRLGESFYYLGLLLQTGSSLAEALDMLGRMSGRRAGQVWLNIRDAVETGESFSKALSGYPRHFPLVYVGMIRVAESVGKLGEVLERIARYEEQRGEVSGRLVTALVYPCVIMLVGFGAVYFLLSRVLPNIAKVFTGAKQSLPAHTQFLLAVGQFLQDLGPVALAVPLLLVLGAVWAYRRKENVRIRVDRALWKIGLVQKYTLARFSGMLGFQLEAGIPLVQALDSSAQATGSAYFRNAIQAARKEVAAGHSLDKVLEKQGIFPEIYLLTLSTGQRAGKLGPFLTRLTRIYELDVDNMLKRVVALAEPLLILGVGLMVGFIVLAIMEPIFELSTLVR